MMGAVKQHFHDEICERIAHDGGEYEPTPQDELEMLAHDVESSIARFLAHAERYPDEARQAFDGLAFGTDKLDHFLKRLQQ